MEYFKFMLKSMTQLIKEHKLLVFLMIVLISCSLSILGLILNQGDYVEESLVDYSNTYGVKTYYFTNEGMTDLIYFEYLEDNNVKIYEKIMKFRHSLLDNQQVSFFNLINQPIEIYKREIPDIFLYDYESGDAESSIFEFEGKTCYMTKALQVSEGFFDEFNINLEDGQYFDNNSYVYQYGKEIPVLMGNSYKDYFQVGDIIECNYLFEDVSLVVIGFLQDDAFYYDCVKESFVSCERYIIMPALESKEINYFSKIMLLQQMEGMIVSDLGYPQTKQVFEKMIVQEEVGELGIYLRDPEVTMQAERLLSSYSSMTEEVSEQFYIIVCIILVFVVISISTLMCGFIREKSKEYGIKILCGAKLIQIAGDILLLDIVILLLGSVIALFILAVNSCTLKSILIVLVISVVLCGVIAIKLICYLYKMDISEIVGGKE